MFRLLCFFMLCLTSCEVHWFGKSYDTPWWTIAIPVTLIFVATWFFAGGMIYYRLRHGKEYRARFDRETKELEEQRKKEELGKWK